MGLKAFVFLLAALSDTSSIIDIHMPLKGVKASELRDNFADARTGHPHEALDMMAARGTPVHAAVPGTIKKLFLSKAGGNTIYEFDENEELCYYYAHLDEYAEGVHEGMRVKRGQLIGYVGSTGNANPEAPHLHFAVFQLTPEKEWWKGKAVDPYPFLVAAERRREK